VVALLVDICAIHIQSFQDCFSEIEGLYNKKAGEKCSCFFDGYEYANCILCSMATLTLITITWLIHKLYSQSLNSLPGLHSNNIQTLRGCVAGRHLCYSYSILSGL